MKTIDKSKKTERTTAALKINFRANKISLNYYEAPRKLEEKKLFDLFCQNSNDVLKR
jgi:hypothetical protein